MTAGAAAVSFDLSVLATADIDLVAELAEAGLALFAGALPTSSAQALAGGPPLPPRRDSRASGDVVAADRPGVRATG